MSTPMGSRCGSGPINTTSSGTRSALAGSVLANQHTVGDAQTASRWQTLLRTNTRLPHSRHQTTTGPGALHGKVTTRLNLQLRCRNHNGHCGTRAEASALVDGIARRQWRNLRLLRLFGLPTVRAARPRRETRTTRPSQPPGGPNSMFRPDTARDTPSSPPPAAHPPRRATVCDYLMLVARCS